MIKKFLHNHGLAFGLISIWLIATAFNINKALTVDDNYYLKTAIAFAQSPAAYLRALVPHHGTWIPIYLFNQPHLLFWIFGFLIKIFGINFFVLHLALSVFTLAAITGMYCLAKIFSPQPLLLTAAFALSPAFLPGQNLMTDIPQIALWLWFFVILLKVEKPSIKINGLLGLLMSGAILIKYSSLVLLPLFAGYVILKKQWARLWFLAMPLAAMTAWSIVTLVQYGGIHILSRPIHNSSLIEIAMKTIHWQIAIGACSLFFIASWRSYRKVALIALSFGFVLTCLYSLFFDPIMSNLYLRFLFLSSGFFVTGVMILFFWSKIKNTADKGSRDHWWLLCGWYLAGMFFIILFAPFMAVRHILLVLPLTLIIFGQQFRPANNTKFYLGLAVTMALGMTLAISDWQWADVYRQQAPRLVHHYQTPTNTVWYFGNWGWQWYAGAQGVQPLTVNRLLRAGDIIITPTIEPVALQLLAGLNLDLVADVNIPATTWTTLRTILPPPYVGYTGFQQQGLPFYISSRSIETFHIYKVVISGQTPQ